MDKYSTLFFSDDSSITFLKIHASDDIVMHFADLCSVDLACRNIYYRPPIPPSPKFMATPLIIPDEDSYLYRRAPDTFSKRLPTTITSAERIMIVYKMLCRTKFGNRRDQYGIPKLLKEKVFLSAYPLHDGPYEWTEFGKLTDRQLLVKFWGNIHCWYKEQPIILIEKYFGTEFAFYFAWLGFYVKMLMPMAILSVLCILYGAATITTSQNINSHEICTSKLILCPRCHYMHCKFESLKSSCLQSHVTYVFDNPATITFAIVISFWSTIFMEFWQRNQSVLQLVWNVKSLENETMLRPEYIENAKRMKYSPVTETNEPYINRRVICLGYTITLFSLLLMLFLVILGVLGVMIYRISVDMMLIRSSKDEIIIENTRVIAAVTGACMNATFIFIFRAIFKILALKLTNLENHRTQQEYDNSFIYKSYSLAFVNNYSAVFYIAFFKGRFFTHPGDMNVWTDLGGLGSDICAPTGCILDLSISLMIIMMSKIIVSNFTQVLLPILVDRYNKFKAKVEFTADLPLYEKEYFMPPTEQYFLVDEYLDMVIQYGFVVFFVAGFPLAPVLAFVNNLLEIRVDASKITQSYRRPVPKQSAGIGPWFGILQATTYIGVATNALVIAFTSNFVQKEIYRHSKDSAHSGFINTTLSAYATKDFEILSRSIKTPKICFYPGRRYDPDHEQAYELTKDFWFLLAIRFLVVLVFEHVIILLKGILAYAIPDVPSYVTLQLAVQERRNRELRMKALNEEYIENRRLMGYRDIFTPTQIS
ncbi:anoctamin-4 isoform X2 [Leptinotarsa decemlineata]|uniref:anoctamin-4 isoform X2 n=1 Tax=Leptinotarsa decemlineata TaxID=7539 RepID=UPI003D307D78